MGDQLSLEPGRAPWKPSKDAELVETLLYNNMPLVGVIRQYGHLYVFRCVEGFADDTHVWAYMLIQDADLAQLRELAAGGDLDLWSRLGNLTAGGQFALALATDQDGIVAVFHTYGLDPPTILESQDFVDLVLKYGFSGPYMTTEDYQEKADAALHRLAEMVAPT